MRAIHPLLEWASEEGEMKRRAAFLAMGMAMAAMLVPGEFAAMPAAKEATVTLEITGMT